MESTHILYSRERKVSFFWLPYTFQATLNWSFTLMISLNGVCDLVSKCRRRDEKCPRQREWWEGEDKAHAEENGCNRGPNQDLAEPARSSPVSRPGLRWSGQASSPPSPPTLSSLHVGSATLGDYGLGGGGGWLELRWHVKTKTGFYRED